MFYAAAILILIGVLIFLYSISVERTVPGGQPVSPSGQRPAGFAPDSRYYPAYNEALKNKADYSTPETRPGKSEETHPSYQQTTTGSTEEPQRDSEEKISEPEPPATDSKLIKTETVSPAHKKETSTEPETQQAESEQKKSTTVSTLSDKDIPEKNDEAVAVFYEDESGNVDYSVPSSEIDPSLETYKKIRRIGEGIISSKQKGINFHIDKKLYRFDFHRISELNRGHDYIALKLTGQKPVKLFIFKQDTSEKEKIFHDYKTYTGESA